ncbi:MAG: hypothetical protein BJ554DRAFT_1771 [Olpidium bornovanus]|uniref:chorismate synthase n=1 Tax=Olpidium bornovanus TaxID=278681 RepID=A0A8H7ZR94_9FUNG|nr:MAG: hypothetical protein BJ554DRAFT_1771 [Olpidium bornovanus]
MSTFGTLFRVTTYGESHCRAVGCTVDGCPPGLPLVEADVQAQLDRRRPGQSRLTTPVRARARPRERERERRKAGAARPPFFLRQPPPPLVVFLSRARATAPPLPPRAARRERQRHHPLRDRVWRDSGHPRRPHGAERGPAPARLLGDGRLPAALPRGLDVPPEPASSLLWPASSLKNSAYPSGFWSRSGRVAAGAVAEKYLKLACGVEIVAFVSSVGEVAVPFASDGGDDSEAVPGPFLEMLSRLTRADVDADETRCPHKETADRMRQVRAWGKR